MKTLFSGLLATLFIGLALLMPLNAIAQVETTTRYGLQMTLKEVVVDYLDLQAAAADASTDTSVTISGMLPAFGDALPAYLELSVIDTVDSVTQGRMVPKYITAAGDSGDITSDSLDVGTAAERVTAGLLFGTASADLNLRGARFDLFYTSGITLDAITTGRIRIKAYYINE